MDTTRMAYGDPELLDLVRVAELVDALVEREQAAHAEQHQRHHERPEVALGAVAERVRVVGGTLAAATAEHEQALVAGVGEAVPGFGQQAGRTGEEEADELGDGDAEVREERGDDGLAAAVLHSGHTTEGCRHGLRPQLRRPQW